MNAQKHAITFIVHGARSSSANIFIKKMIRNVTGRNKHVNVGFLEFATPDLADAVRRHIQNGNKKIRLIPLLLATGKHLKQDVPAILKPIRKEYPDVKIVLEKCLGAQKGFQEFIRKISS